MHVSLNPKGYLWYTGYPDFERKVGGGHLQEAADCREAAYDYVQEHFKRATQVPIAGLLYQKK